MSIEQHPIPQDVAGYKFRLIGDMTLKQFIWLAAGIILGLVFYQLPLPFFFKYPLAAISVLLGAGIAFVPVEGRPMDKWLIAFIRSIYTPTQYVWQKDDGQDLSATPGTTKSPVSTSTSRGLTPAVSPPRSGAKTPSISKIPSIPEGPEEPVVSPAPTPIPEPPKPDLTPASPPRSESGGLSEPSAKGAVVPTIPSQTIVPPKVVPSATPTPQLPIPFTPTTGNTLVGMTLTPDGKILDGCLIEIISNGLSLRATKSNQLGQFLFAKPLENGLYQIITEKTGFQFDTYSLNLTGQIVKPLRLQAKTNV